jgi:PAS domain S-box-containing protein
LRRWPFAPVERGDLLVRWGLALAAFAAALAIRWFGAGVLPHSFPFLTFLPAVMLAAFWCGTAPSIVVAILSGLAAWGLFMGPRPFAATSTVLVGMSFFAFLCALPIWLIGRLRRVADEFRTLADNIPILCWMARPDGQIYWTNRRVTEYAGAPMDTQEEWEGQHDPAVLPLVEERWQRSVATGEPFEMTFPLKGADGVFRPFLTRGVPIRDDAGRVNRWFGVNIDVTAQERHEQQQQLLINELNHRVKNTLATVQSIAAQTLRSGADPRQLFENFEARLISLSEAHNLLTQASWEGAYVGDLVERAIRPFQNADRSAIEAQGPPVWLRSESVLSLSMALHELGTNAIKYGALSVAGGRVAVRWDLHPVTGGFQLSWSESGGPRVEPPSRRGFGLRLIERALAAERDGRTELNFRPDGLVCTITAKCRPALALE